MIDSKLLSLLKVAETGSFSKAAEALSLSQPAVSHHVRALEEELQTTIFERVHNELRITRTGNIIVRYARRMVSLDAKLRRELNGESNHMVNYRIGITHTAESNAIAEALAKYVCAHDGVSFQIVTDTMNNLYERLNNYELDFAVVEGRIHDDRLTYLMLDTDCLVLAVAPEHPLTKRNIVTIDEIKRERLILRLPDSKTRRQFVSALESQNLSIDDFNVILELNNIATIKDLIRRNFGVSVLAKSACMDEVNKKKLVVLPIENLSMIRENNIVYPSAFTDQEMLKEIVSYYSEK